MFVVVWNLTATFHIYYVKPNLDDKSSEDFCDPSTYYLAFVLVILFDVTFAIISFIWVSALIAGKFSNHLYVKPQIGTILFKVEPDLIKTCCGSFKNHVDIILLFFDHLPTFVDIFYVLNVDKKCKL